ncbi:MULTISPECIES: NAD(P)H-dependent oxidoreductase [unclassified Methanoculleus]|uniref:NAD(P)H-dependent oxidoreductase n=1 Tax=unclassified Methanoculleus TaxID=2619537 RepID=UPI0025DA0EE6|nr:MULTISPECIES: NAD(P)H-dependent oxidoreductase [unclassified Methanoculleus]MCK9317762.1 NAD(P)H-dependent oxidoreductase [Methanoculleus sp.]MDD2254844.1 NAD(P)H-dependent oxidoreductase [Methanoculleus sp.]MDD2787672.1 NAD(P)H-dependent oxidoreductase [Methanoculleus sp.]MDD3217116.1 NAD(P)H-dependent oxidoreductase [Methanoculleus sp.]MDD4314651.1 NAD(P)H-dependent oxidoreductase [Methanoculleus sp.]
MQIRVISGSPKGEKSVTLQYVRFLEQAFPEHTFSVAHVGQEIKTIERQEEVWNRLLAAVKESDGVLWATPVYCMLVPAQLKRFIELIGTRNAAETFSGKYAASLTTSIHFFDHTAHAYLHGVCDDLGMRYAGSCSAHMQDLEKEAFQEQLVLFFSDFLEAIEERRPVLREFPSLPALSSSYVPETPPAAVDTRGKRVVILHDAEPGSDLEAMVRHLTACYAGSVQVAHIRDAMMNGGCLGCCRCALENTCIYDDGFMAFWRRYVVAADILVMAGTVRDRFFSAAWKRFIDRSFFSGHVPAFKGKQVAYLVEGPLGHLATLREVLTSLVMTEKANLAGIVTNEPDPGEIDAALQALAERSVRLAGRGYIAPATFPAVGGHKIFRDEIWGGMRATFKADDRYYRQHGLYDFPTWNYLQRIGTRVTSLAMSIPSVRREVVKSMPAYMIQPLQKSIETSRVLAERRKRR